MAFSLLHDHNDNDLRSLVANEDRRVVLNPKLSKLLCKNPEDREIEALLR